MLKVPSLKPKVSEYVLASLTARNSNFELIKVPFLKPEVWQKIALLVLRTARNSIHEFIKCSCFKARGMSEYSFASRTATYSPPIVYPPPPTTHPSVLIECLLSSVLPTDSLRM